MKNWCQGGTTVTVTLLAGGFHTLMNVMTDYSVLTDTQETTTSRIFAPSNFRLCQWQTVLGSMSKKPWQKRSSSLLFSFELMVDATGMSPVWQTNLLKTLARPLPSLVTRNNPYKISKFTFSLRLCVSLAYGFNIQRAKFVIADLCKWKNFSFPLAAIWDGLAQQGHLVGGKCHNCKWFHGWTTTRVCERSEAFREWFAVVILMSFD